MHWNQYRLFWGWLFWFGVITFGAIIAWHQGFITILIAGDKTGIVMGIFSVVIFGIIWNMKNMFLIQREINHLSKWEEILAKKPIDLSKKELMIRDISAELANVPRGIFWEHIKTLHRVYQKKKQIPRYENLIEAIFARMLIPETWTLYIASIATVVGFLGTLVGFAMMNSNVNTIMAGTATAEKSLQGIGTVLGSIGTAIFTSIVGFIGAIILLLFKQLVENTITRLAARMVELDEEYIQGGDIP